jgi:integrase
VGTFLEDRWLPARESTLRPSTHESYTQNVRTHVIPAIGGQRLQSLDAATLTTFYGERLKSGLSARSVRYIHTIVRMALADALKWDLVVRNVADAATPPSASAARPPTMKTWGAGELRRFLEHVCEDRLCAAWHVLAMTGIRRGELLGLDWKSRRPRLRAACDYSHTHRCAQRAAILGAEDQPQSAERRAGRRERGCPSRAPQAPVRGTACMGPRIPGSGTCLLP